MRMIERNSDIDKSPSDGDETRPNCFSLTHSRGQEDDFLTEKSSRRQFAAKEGASVQANAAIILENVFGGSVSMDYEMRKLPRVVKELVSDPEHVTRTLLGN
tara:strand:+ start:202 stop:507 length:306 start_codon:yes stop_codon:yes gene_type:complete